MAISVAAKTDGEREIVDFEIALSGTETFWAGFLKSLVRSGLRGVMLMISGAHAGLSARTDLPSSGCKNARSNSKTSR